MSDLPRATATAPAKKRPTVWDHLTSAGRKVITDPGIQAGLAQIVASLASLAVRAVSPRNLALVRRDEHDL